MTQKPEIQYIGQFYSYGSEARSPEIRVPAENPAPVRSVAPKKKIRVYVDPVALVGILVAVAMVLLMAVSTVEYVDAVQECEAMETYVVQLRDNHSVLTHNYLASIDWDYVESTARAIGMVPAAEAARETVRVTMPEPKQEPTLWDDLRWFFSGLFA